MCIKSNASEVLHALDAVEEVQTALSGFDELLAPEPSLQGKARDHVACLFNYLLRHQTEAQSALRRVLFGQGGSSC